MSEIQTGHRGVACLCSLMSWASAEKEKAQGNTNNLGAGIIWRLLSNMSGTWAGTMQQLGSLKTTDLIA